MYLIALICSGAQAIVSLLVGLRLLGLARRTREFPELALSTMTLLLPAVGVPGTLLGRGFEAHGLPGVSFFYFVGVSAIGVAVSMAYFFTWRVFRPHSGWAMALSGVGAWLMIAPVGALAAHIEVSGIDEGIRNARIWTLTIVGSQLVAWSWAGTESFRYFLGLRRRLRLGLVAPRVCNRFLLWAVLSIAWWLAAAMAGVVLLADVEPLSNVPFTFCFGLTGLVNSLCMVLCFMPPRRYLAWLERRAKALQES